MLAADFTVREYRSDDTLLGLPPYTFEGGKTLPLTVGIGSSAFRHPSDPANVIWTMGDRGPNITCNDMKEVAGVELAGCRGVKDGRVYLTPSYSPSIYRVMMLDDGTFRFGRRADAGAVFAVGDRVRWVGSDELELLVN